MNVCFLLHFYQPSNQFGDVIKKIAHESYIPLIKSLKNNKKVSITANFPLSLLEQLDRFGYRQLINDIKELVEAGRIELVGSAAYHPLLTKIPPDFVDRQIVLNEMSLGYYFGSTRDFEGEDCFMIKDAKGFFPPEMSVNTSLVEQIFNLGYEWVALDEYSLPKDVRERHMSGMCYSLSNKSSRLIVRDRALTNLISFKRNLDRSEIIDKIADGRGDKVIAMDAETFGHHYKEGVDLFESLISDIHERGIQTATISQAFSGVECKGISHIEESTWSSVEGSTYPLWENSVSKVNMALWSLMENMHVSFSEKFAYEVPEKNENFTPVWKHNHVGTGNEVDKKEKALLNLLKSEQSDQFWWSTGLEVMGKVNYSRYMVSSVLDYYKEVISSLELGEALSRRVREIEDLLI